MRALLAAAVLLLAALPVADAQAAPQAAHVVVYHAHPDPRAGHADADPFSTPLAPGPAVRHLPATRLDGVVEADPAPEGQPESVPAHFRELQRHLLARERAGAPLPLEVDATIDAANGTLRVRARLLAAPPEGNATLDAVVVEDALPHEGASGVRVHRFVARLALPAQPADDASWEAALDPAWDAGRLSVVVAARADGGEVLQSARWRAGQEGPTVQRAKAVLVEHVTATWCVPCGPADEAVALLASQFGGEAQVAGAGGLAYARAPGAAALAGLAAGGAAAFLVLRRRGA